MLPQDPLPGGDSQKRKMAVFRLEVHFSGRKSATKFLCVKTVSDKVVRHSLAYLSVQKCVGGDVPLYLKIWPKLINPLKNADFKSVFPRRNT